VLCRFFGLEQQVARRRLPDELVDALNDIGVGPVVAGKAL